MHLDFGPVYSFWLFSFERLNGILGSYHTNCHDISVQLMRRFTSSIYHGTHNWPAEYRDELSSLIFYHDYQKGSLQATTLEQVLEQYQSHKINPLPPVHEAAWELHQKPGLHYLVKALVGHDNYTLLTLYNKASSLSVGGYILGSTSSRFVTKSHVMAIHPKYPNELYLAKIEYFAKLDARDNTNTCFTSIHSNGELSIWIACVSFYYMHDCKVWFGGPTQVWCRSTSPDHYYISLSSFKCRVAHCKTVIDFGRVIGKQTVFVVSVITLVLHNCVCLYKETLS